MNLKLFNYLLNKMNLYISEKINNKLFYAVI